MNKLREFRPNQTILETTPKTTPNSLNPSKAVNEAPNSVQTMKLKRILDDTRVSQHRKKIEQQKTQIEQEQLKSAECFEEETDVTNTQMSKNDGLVLNGISKEPQISATTETSLNKPTQHPKVSILNQNITSCKQLGRTRHINLSKGFFLSFFDSQKLFPFDCIRSKFWSTLSQKKKTLDNLTFASG